MSGPGRRRDGSRPAHCLGRSVKELQERLASTQSGVCQLQERDAEAQPVQAGQESSLNDSDGLDFVVPLELTVDLIGNTRELQGADATQVVDQQGEFIPGLMSEEGAVGIVMV